jgi:tetratricopeptide (TPR) repeat protein
MTAAATDPPAASAPPVRVFISSPADVRPERLIAERVVRRLAREFAYHFRVEPLLWEREPLLASHHFQDLLVPPRETDIVVVILWSRLGVLLPERYVGALSGGRVTGTEWEFEDALDGARRSGRLPELLLFNKRTKALVELGDRAQVEEQQRQAELVEAFMTRWTREADGKAFAVAFWPFDDATQFERELEEKLRALLRKRLTDTTNEGTATVRWHEGSPFRGLETFGPEHEQIFFGRTRARHQLRELLARRVAEGTAFVLVTGASGSGKSSLVKAGLLPELREAGMLGNTALVRHAITRPAAADGEAADPLLALAASLLAPEALPELRAAPLLYDEARLRDALRDSVSGAVQAIRQGLSAAGASAGVMGGGEARLLLIIDQLEEAFTAKGIVAETRRQYFTALTALARSGLVWIVATLRSDFLVRIERAPTLLELVPPDAIFRLVPPDGTEIAEIIRRPAREAGLRFEVDAATHRGLDDVIREDAGRDAASLPLLEYLLEQLWHRRTAQGELTYAAYAALGGLEGAIGRRADAVLAALPEATRGAFPAVLRALVTVGEDAESTATARAARKARFSGGERGLVEALLKPDARLLVADGPLVRVAHEALLARWPLAAAQIAADRSDLRIRARLEAAASRWREAAEKDRDALLLQRGLPLSEADDLVTRRGAELDADVVAFVGASLDRAGRAARLRRYALIAVASVSIAAAIVFAGLGEYARRKSVQSEQSFEAAAAALSTLIDSVPEQVGPVAPLHTIEALLAEAEAAIAKLPPETAATNPRVQLYRGTISLTLGEINFDLGKFAQARRRGDAAMRDFARVLELSPADRNARRGRARGERLLGAILFVQTKEDPIGAEATRALTRAVEEFDSLLKGKPEAPVALGLRLLRAAALQELGDVLLMRARKPGEAHARFTEALDERQAVAHAIAYDGGRNGIDPDAVEYATAWTVNKLGDVLLMTGQPAEALRAFSRARDRLAKLGPALARNKLWQVHLAVAHNNIGSLMRRGQSYDEAIRELEKAIPLTEELRRRDPDNALASAIFLWTWDNIGETQFRWARAERDPNRLRLARDAYGQAPALRTKLAADSAIGEEDLMYSQAMRQALESVSLDLDGVFEAAGMGYAKAADLMRELSQRTRRDGHVLYAVEMREWAAEAFMRARLPDRAREELNQAIAGIDAQVAAMDVRGLGEARERLEARLREPR